MPVRRLIENPLHRLCQRNVVTDRNERSDFSVPKYFRRTGGTVGADTGTAACQCLHQNHRKTFASRGQHEQGGAGHERQWILYPPGKRDPVREPESLNKPLQLHSPLSFAEDDHTARASRSETGESLDESGKVLCSCQSPDRKNDRRAAVQEPGMVRTLRHPDMEIRRDDGIVQGRDTLARNPDGGCQTVGNTLRYANQTRRALEQTLVPASVTVAAIFDKGMNDRHDRRMFSQQTADQKNHRNHGFRTGEVWQDTIRLRTLHVGCHGASLTEQARVEQTKRTPIQNACHPHPIQRP